jgi:hypothetical protein
MEKSFRIVVMGDSSSSVAEINSDILRKLLANIKKLSPQPKYIFFVGDMVYGGGKVNEQLEKWKKLVEEYYPISMFYTALGNHEDNESAFSNAFTHLPKEQLEGYNRTAYYIDNRNTRFIVLNSNRTDSNGNYIIGEDQRKWLKKLLKSSELKYTFVMFHIPAFPTGHHYKESLDGNAEERNRLLKIMDTYNVTGVFVGHEHNYCRRMVDNTFDSSSLELKNHIYHITTGGAGTSLSSSSKDARNVEVGPVAVFNYAVVDINDNKVELKAFDIENNIIDSCTMSPYSSDSTSKLTKNILIPLNSTWRYLDDGSNQGELWRKRSFNDYSWKKGPAELGYGDGGEATVVSYGDNIHKKYITTYFRKSFNVNNAYQYKKLTISIQRDDGAVVYLNGKEVYRTNMPSGSIDYKTVASKAINGVEEVTFEKIVIDADNLRDGINVIAVEVHQANASSSDISFNFQLLGHKK